MEVALLHTVYLSAPLTRSFLPDLQLGLPTSPPGCCLVIPYGCEEQLSLVERVSP